MGGQPIHTSIPNLWQVGWDGGEVAGGVLQLHINKPENEVIRPFAWLHRRHLCADGRGASKGLAKALIARSFQVLKG